MKESRTRATTVTSVSGQAEQELLQITSSEVESE